MHRLLIDWVEINSGSYHLEGLERMGQALKHAFAPLEGTLEEIPLAPISLIDSSGHVFQQPLGKALRIRKRSHAPIQVLLAGHMDTVYPASSTFQKTERLTPSTLRGPGCTDMKGGLVILLKALEMFERFPEKNRLGWEVLITPDEELGSPSSQKLFLESAKRVDAGLIFEPSFPDGSLVSARKGSFNFTLVAHGKSAHAGRDFSSGINAISGLMGCLIKIEALNNPSKALTVNIGKIEGGGPVNIIPSLAIGSCNARVASIEDLNLFKKNLEQIIAEENRKGKAQITLHQEHERAPRAFDEAHLKLFTRCQQCAKALGCDLTWKPSGGVCDGNILSNAGVPTIDTLGAVGGNIHTHDEYIELDSLLSRSKIVALLLLELSKGL